MDFSWTDEQVALRRRVTEFAERTLNHGVVERDRDGTFDRDAWLACGAEGLHGLLVPPAFGGRGLDALTAVLALEGLGYGCRDRGLTFGVAAHLTSAMAVLTDFGTEQHKREWLPDLCAGHRIAAYAITEPGAGSDAYSITATARRTDAGYVLDGEKMLVTLAPVADLAIVFASTNPAARRWGLSVFLVPRDTPGFEVGPEDSKMGLRSVPIGRFTLRECEVPAASRIGAEGAGAAIFNASQEWERFLILAPQLGAMQRQLETCVRYARDRQAFGQSIGKFQAVSNRIAEMKLRLDTSRLLTYRAAWVKQTGQAAMLEAALANLHVAESDLASSLDAVRIHGGRGYLTEYEVERDLRDAVGSPIYGGTSDIQRNIVSRLLGL